MWYCAGILELVAFFDILAVFLMLATWLVGQTPGTFSSSLSADPANHTLSFRESAYFFGMTATTIGYGDICPASMGARVFTIYFASLATTMILIYSDRWTELTAEREIQLKRARALNRELDPSIIDKLDTSKDGKVELAEYVLGMLQLLEVVKEEDVKPLIARFQELDRDGSGYLDRGDLVGLLERRKVEIRVGSAPGAKGSKVQTIGADP